MDREEQQQAGIANPEIAKHLAGVRVDLHHVQELLRDAIDKLLTDAFAIRQSCRDAQPGNPAAAASSITPVTLAAIGQHADSMLTNLQFQDMVSQLLEHVRIGVEAAEVLAGSGTSAGASEMAKEPTDTTETTPDGRTKPVQSRDMSAGDIDLF